MEEAHVSMETDGEDAASAARTTKAIVIDCDSPTSSWTSEAEVLSLKDQCGYVLIS